MDAPVYQYRDYSNYASQRFIPTFARAVTCLSTAA